MTILIDSNNLLHKISNLKYLFKKDKDSAQISLVESVRSRLNKSDKVIFIFDGFGKSDHKDVIFSNELTADELIRLRIENFRDHKKLKVVSSDNNIKNLSRICGCETQRSEDFWKEINEIKSVTKGKNINQNYIYDKKEKPDRMNKKEIEEFKHYFT